LTDVSTIDFGDLCPNQIKDTVFKIENTGTLGNTAQMNIPSDFSTLNNNIHLSYGESGIVSLSFHGRSMEGLINETLTITDSICGRQISIILRGRIRKPLLNADDLVLSTTVGSYTVGQVELRNPSDYDLIIQNEPLLSDNQFSFVDANFPMTISAKNKEYLTIRYEPRDSIESSIALAFDYEPCNSSKTITVSGSPVAASVDMLIDTIKAKTGDIVNIPIYLKNANNVQLTSTTGYTFDLIFNYTLLDPLDYPNFTVVDGKRIVSFDVPKDADKNGIIANVKCRVCLGNSNETDLEIANYKSKGGVVAIRKQNGKLIITDICEEGGKRLINPDGKAEILYMAPNPTTGELDIDINLIEVDYTELYLANIMGLKVIMIYSGYVPKAGIYNLKVNVNELSSGIYYLILQTPTLRKVEKLLIER